jgi:hypothetical protein
MFRRGVGVVGIAWLVPLVLAASVATATPTVKILRGEAVPIPGFPHTGNIYGAGAAVRAEAEITGTEYVGSPPPIIGVNVYLPTGTKLHPAGFPTCPKSTLEPTGRGPSACPKGSSAGPVGHVLGVVSLGGERVKEEATIEPFYAPGGGIEFYAVGHSPVALEVIATGHYVNLGGGGGYGPEVVTEIPLVSTVPGAPYASAERISVQAGSAIRKGKHVIYYGRVPRKGMCPKGGFKVKVEVMFAGVGGLVPETVTVPYRAPCPKR